jgi:hypothetical protein
MAKRVAIVLLLVPVLGCANLGGLTGGDASSDDKPPPDANATLDAHAARDAAKDGSAGCKVDCGAPRDAKTDDARTAKDGGSDVAVDDAQPVPDARAPDAVAPVCESGVSCSAENPCAPAMCMTATCGAGCCASAFASVATPCAADGGAYCDGTGGCVACLTDMQCPVIATPCMKAVCTENRCVAEVAPAGTACSSSMGGKVCNAAGACVECTTADNSACTGATPYCSTSDTCVECTTNAQCSMILMPTCTNGMCVGL